MNAWLDHVPALFESWFAGQEGGSALAQLLFGDFSPSGKLPVTFERRWEDNAAYATYYPKPGEKKTPYTEGVFTGYRHFDKDRIKPQFPFGYGLSYTTFSYRNLTVNPAKVSGDQSVTASFDVANTGKAAGAEVAEVYVGEEHPAVPRPVKELKGFTKVFLKPGESKHVSVELNRRAFSYYDVAKHRWTADTADFDILVGPSSAQIELTGKVTRQSP
jgi:beta-glucosidase